MLFIFAVLTIQAIHITHFKVIRHVFGFECECPLWCSIFGATVTVHQFYCVLHWDSYIQYLETKGHLHIWTLYIVIDFITR